MRHHLSINIYIFGIQGKTKSLKEITKKGEFPCKITFTETYHLNQRGDTSLRIDPTVSMVLEGQTDLRYLLGNPVTGGEFYNKYDCYLPKVLVNEKNDLIFSCSFW